jgi:tRNA modification GTPase
MSQSPESSANDDATITAIATARGQAALAIVRTSGPQAIGVVNRCFDGADLTEADSHTAHVGYLTGANGSDGNRIDEVVATVFRAPRSATGEDVVEVSCHGGDVAARLVLEALLRAGARHADPGEFTERAFLNGKMDLAQAEAVADLIHASSEKAHRAALTHLEGRYSRRLEALREELLDLCAFVELELDFGEEDVEFADRERLEQLLDDAEALLTKLLDSYQTGEKLRDGVRVVIGGRPNAGKSTLLNALVGRERAITSEAPGTTRDEIEAEVEIEGWRFRFIDTAGLREAAGDIEAEGVRRAEASIEQADVLLYVFDLAVGLEDAERDFLAELSDEQSHTVLIGNKRDLISNGAAPAEDVGGPYVPLSAEKAQREAERLDPLVDRLTEYVAEHLGAQDASAVVMNQRHRQHLRTAREAIGRARRALDRGASGDMLTLDLREALDELGAITGEVTNEDVLGQIFSRFCIGK